MADGSACDDTASLAYMLETDGMREAEIRKYALPWAIGDLLLVSERSAYAIGGIATVLRADNSGREGAAIGDLQYTPFSSLLVDQLFVAITELTRATHRAIAAAEQAARKATEEGPCLAPQT